MYMEQIKPLQKKLLIPLVLTLVLLAAIPLTLATMQTRTNLKQEAHNGINDDEAAVEKLVTTAETEDEYTRVNNRYEYYKKLRMERRQAIRRFKVCKRNHRPQKCWKNIEQMLPPGLLAKFRNTITPMPTEVVPDEPTPPPDIIQSPDTPDEPTMDAARLTVTVCPHHIGDCTDVDGHNQGNLSPVNSSKTLTLSIYNSSNQLARTADMDVTYDIDTKRYKGMIALDSFPAGAYIIKVSMPHYLQATIPGIQTINITQDTILPPVMLIPGDINTDSVINKLDYTLLEKCISDLRESPCSKSEIAAADLDDNGQVNSIDYNILFRTLSEIKGF